jgi:hypothetical protein
MEFRKNKAFVQDYFAPVSPTMELHFRALMKFTRIVTVTQVWRKIALAGTVRRCPRCGCELTDSLEAAIPEKPRKLPPPGEKDRTGK